MPAASEAFEGEVARLTQFAFDLSRPGAFGRVDFFASEANAAALGWIDRWPGWPAPVLVLHGDQGAGKTHLAHLWCARAGAVLIAGEVLSQAHIESMIERRGMHIAVDDADRAAAEILLHLFNACVEVGGNLLLTARRAPGDWPLVLPDLCSRIRAATAIGIAPPDDALLSAVLVKHFADRQLRVSAEIIAYIVSRMERSLAATAAIAAALDQAALRRRGAITTRMARQVLAALSDQSPSSDTDAGVK